MTSEGSLLSWISQVRRKKLTAISEWLCDPSVIRQTECFEFTDLTNVNHEIRTELSDELWPLEIPVPREKKEKGLVVLGFMRRGIPLQHTEVSLFRGGDEYRLTRLKSEDTENLALVLLDNVWRQCGQSELKSDELLREETQAGTLLEPTIPRPFEMPDYARFGALDGKQKYSSRFWREFLGIGNRNVNADWLLLQSRFKLRESEIANELFRHPRQDQPKWSVERALLAKLAARLAFSYIAAAWVPPEACEAKGPTEIGFKFQERVLSPAEQKRRVWALDRRAKKAWERSLTEVLDETKSEEELQTDGARIRSTPETYLGLLDPALDDPDDHGRMPSPYEPASMSRTEERVELFKRVRELKDEGHSARAFLLRNGSRFKGSWHWARRSLSSLLRFLRDNLGRLVIRGLGLILVVWMTLNAWHTLGFKLPPKDASWPAGEEWSYGITLGFLMLLIIPLLLVLFLAAASSAHRLVDSPARQSSSDSESLITCLRESLRVGACIGGIALLGLVLSHQGPESSLVDLARSSIELSSDPFWGALFLLVAALVIGWFVSSRLSIERRKTVVVPTWSGGRTAPIHEVITPKEFSVWQGVLVRPSNRGRSWKTRPAVELGRKASFWWQDPTDRGHVPGFVPGRPHLMVMELRARLSRDLTLLGSILCFIAAVLLATPALIQLSNPTLWGQLQSAGADSIITILLLLPTAGGALLVRPGEDPIAASLLRADRLAVGIGAVLVSAVGAGSIIMLGWPEHEGLPTAFWTTWLVLGSVALCFGFALMRGYRHSRQVNEPQPDSRQGAVSDSRRNPLDVPGPLPPVSSKWGRLFARRTLLRLAPRRGVRKVTPLYHLLLPAEGSRIYTPPSPTIVCLVRGDDQPTIDDRLLEAKIAIDTVLDRGRRREDPISGTNDLGWVASRSLSVVEPLERITTSSLRLRPGREESLLHLLRLQHANSRPNSTRPFGNGGGICVLEIPPAVFDDLKSRNDESIARQLNEGGGNAKSRRLESPLHLGDEQGLLPEANQVVASGGQSTVERDAAHRLIAAVNRASLDFDGLVLLDLGAKEVAILLDRNGREKKVPISQLEVGNRIVVGPGDKVLTDGEVVEGSSEVDESPIFGGSERVKRVKGETVKRGSINLRAPLEIEVTSVGSPFVSDFQPLLELEDCLGQEAAERARRAGTGVGAHPWPSSLESPLAGESDFWQGTLRLGTLRSLRLPLLLPKFRFRAVVKPFQKLVFDHGVRKIPAASIKIEWNGDEETTALPVLGPGDRKLFDWIEGIPRVYSRIFSSGGFPSRSRPAGTGIVRPSKPLRVRIEGRLKEIKAGAPPREPRIVFIGGNVGSGKTRLALKLRQKMSEVDMRSSPPVSGKRWEHIAPYERHNLFFQLLNLDEPRRIDEEERNYALFGERHMVRNELELLMQETFLIEVAARLNNVNLAGKKSSRDRLDGVLVEYWPEMSVEVMGGVALNPPAVPAKFLTELKDLLASWKAAASASLRYPIIIIPAEEVDNLIERNANRKAQRRNEKIDSEFLWQTDGALRRLLESGYGVCLVNSSSPIHGLTAPVGVPPESDPGEWRSLQPLGNGGPPYQQGQVVTPAQVRNHARPRSSPRPIQYRWPLAPGAQVNQGKARELIVIVDVDKGFAGGLAWQLAMYLR